MSETLLQTHRLVVRKSQVGGGGGIRRGDRFAAPLLFRSRLFQMLTHLGLRGRGASAGAQSRPVLAGVKPMASRARPLFPSRLFWPLGPSRSYAAPPAIRRGDRSAAPLPISLTAAPRYALACAGAALTGPRASRP